MSVRSFEDGQAQVVPESFDPSTWVRQQLRVETEFDTNVSGQLLAADVIDRRDRADTLRAAGQSDIGN